MYAGDNGIIIIIIPEITRPRLFSRIFLLGGNSGGVNQTDFTLSKSHLAPFG